MQQGQLELRVGPKCIWGKTGLNGCITAGLEQKAYIHYLAFQNQGWSPLAQWIHQRYNWHSFYLGHQTLYEPS
jgi:hypothetical protein